MKIALVSMAALAAVSSGAAEVGPLVMDAEKPFAYAYDDAKAMGRVLDHTRDLATVPVALDGGRLTLEKADDNSAAFLVEL